MRVTTEVLGGAPFTVRRWGDQALPMLLMLHGFPEYGGAWEEVAERLCHRFHCVAPDQRGYGASYAPEAVSDYAMSRLVGDAVALIGDAPVAVLGHDWGASVAYGLAMRHPARVSHLIVVNGAHPVPFQRAISKDRAQCEASQYITALRAPGSETRLARDDFAGLMRLISARMDASWLSGARLAMQQDIWRQSGLGGMINWYRAAPLIVSEPGAPVAMPDLPLDRMGVACPHLLIWGTDDTALLAETTRGLEHFAPDLTRLEVQGADHWICHQKPDTVATAILEWV